MRPKTSGIKLPPRMLARKRKLKSGKTWVGYYYNGRDDDGKRVEISLGTDLAAAKRKWAELECREAPPDASLMSYAFDQYERDILPKKKPSTQRENMLCLKQLRAAFGKAPIDSIRPQDIAVYRDARSAPVRANREIALLSHVFNMAREWGYTQRDNPCRGVRKNKEAPRDYYAEADVWDAVYAVASEALRDAMDLAYLTGQRPADVLKMKKLDIRNDELHVLQNKTRHALRIRLHVDGEPTQLGACVDRLLARPVKSMSGELICTDQGQPLTMKMLRGRFDAARAAAAEKALKDRNADLAQRIKAFQFRDIRPKAASEMTSLEDASKLLGHTDNQITKKVYRRVGESVKPTK
ncbi:tyrosine-type recombinase/integrase [Massilia varians]|uniref:tyrosine-type recombinase/integrase n=1 Tax=Massilia varians TaxID=457921 RepID=UPI002552CDA5|nr:tyrosine-type recombinase/integrase [Massilia varians]MDK6078964.1 tyrosine-type recombinase/integrase [Massilia varians]